MSSKTLHNLAWIPIFLIGLSAAILGPGWIFSGEPWLLDKHANEILLGMSYSELFGAEENANLPQYLTLLYRFFGLWVLSVGLLISGYVLVTRMGTSLARNTLHGIVGLMLIGIYLLENHYIPSSPFVYLSHVHMVLYVTSVAASFQLNRLE